MISREVAGGVVYIKEIATSFDILEAKITLTDAEREYYEKISAPKRRSEWLTSRVVLREVLGAEVSTDYRGRVPIVVGSDKFISISHTDNIVVLYISDRVCGVDIEPCSRSFERVKNRFLSQKELSWMNGEDIALAWSVKEAAYKLIGVPDIDFGTMFIIETIDKEKNIAVMSYNGNKYHFNFFRYNSSYNICYSC